MSISRLILGLMLLPSGCVSAPAEPTLMPSPATAVLPLAPVLPTATSVITPPPTLTPEPTLAPADTAPAPAITPTATRQPTPDSPFLPIQEHDWQRGPVAAPVTLIEYGDFQSPECAQLESGLNRLQTVRGDQVQFVFRHLPLTSVHDKAQLAAEAAEAAGVQGKFWELHDLLFARQREWLNLRPAAFRQKLITYATQLGLDAARFQRELDAGAYTAVVQGAHDQATALGLAQPPAVVVNGRPWPATVPLNQPDILVGYIDLLQRQFPAPPPMAVETSHNYTATLVLDQGKVVINLKPRVAPITVNNFIFLARHGFYDNVPFVRVIRDFAAQTGDPSGTGLGGPGYVFPDEIQPGVKFDGPGVVAMANAGPGTNGSQFFITYKALPYLDGHYTIFGRVVSGMDIIQSLQKRDPQTDPSAPFGDRIRSIGIEEVP